MAPHRIHQSVGYGDNVVYCPEPKKSIKVIASKPVAILAFSKIFLFVHCGFMIDRERT